jgi:hypothetical protein
LSPQIVQNYIFSRNQQPESQQHGSQKANVLRRSVNDSVLKLDALSTGLAFDYGNVGFLRIFARMGAGSVVFELQTSINAHVVVLQVDFHAPIYVVFAPYWCDFP